MLDKSRRYVARRHNHAHAQLGQIEQMCSEGKRQTNAAVRGRISRQQTTVQSNARPRKSLHMGHVGIIIQVGVMLGVFLNDAKDTNRRFASRLTARNGRSQDPAIRIVNCDLLTAQRDDSHNWLASTAGGDRLY